ncbi:MAG: CPBP family intramembrane metalloprotease [Candidatus Atelocyanobacterium sp. ALOHA_A2.5_9]|jgi:membrane protease YdiL (CAAX protease family)|nr:CPBP family intramembrane metalloprotease [Candidatus Atelocyanobacterium sp. ALOHA_A2.5_9]|tara:strand:- start:30429 stop:31331 length:903 start_codon:yes stop_codon:yes gene_type:complete
MLLRAVQDSLGFILNRIKWEVVSSSLFIEQLSISFKTFPSEIKITLLILTWFIIWLPIAIFVSKKIVWKPLEPLKPNQKILLLSSLYLLVPVLIFLILILDDKSLANYGLVLNYKFLIDFFLGLFISLLSLIILFKIEEKFNYLKWNFENKAILKKILLPTLSLVLWIGLTEELVFRGLIQTILEDDHNILIAAIICNVVFMLLHLIWEREETIPQLPGLWLMGMVLTEAKWFYGSLGMPWGLHAGWILGISLLESAKLITYTDSAGNYIVGVKQKPLAGIMGILSLLITAIILWCLTMF